MASLSKENSHRLCSDKGRGFCHLSEQLPSILTTVKCPYYKAQVLYDILHTTDILISNILAGSRIIRDDHRFHQSKLQVIEQQQRHNTCEPDIQPLVPNSYCFCQSDFRYYE